MNNRGFVYKWTHLESGQYYIGIHKGSPDDGYIASGRKFNQLWKETYGEGWRREILLEGDYYNECGPLERKLVNRETLKDPLMLNTNVGGARCKGGGGYVPQKHNVKVQGNYRVKPQQITYKGSRFESRMAAIKYLDITFEELDRLLVEEGWQKCCEYNTLNTGQGGL